MILVIKILMGGLLGECRKEWDEGSGKVLFITVFDGWTINYVMSKEDS
jgi:hypothetical protein